jgi:hypothetical protein
MLFLFRCTEKKNPTIKGRPSKATRFFIVFLFIHLKSSSPSWKLKNHRFYHHISRVLNFSARKKKRTGSSSCFVRAIHLLSYMHATCLTQALVLDLSFSRAHTVSHRRALRSPTFKLACILPVSLSSRSFCQTTYAPTPYFLLPRTVWPLHSTPARIGVRLSGSNCRLGSVQPVRDIRVPSHLCIRIAVQAVGLCGAQNLVVQLVRALAGLRAQLGSNLR